MEIDIKPKLWRITKPIEEVPDIIPEIDANIGYDNFFENYLYKNQACLVKNISSNWAASKNWVLPNGELNYDHLYAKYGQSEVMVYDCDEKYYNSQKTQYLEFNKYLIYWESYRKSNYAKDFPLLYLKDWHLKNKFPDDLFYEVPLIFSSDWLNEYLVDNNKDDYRFVYMGPKGSWTPFHADVFKSYSWSVNIYGKKRWVLFPPGEELRFKDSFNELPYDIDPIKGDAKFFEIIQKAGDGIFVPSNWHHQVWNLEDTISINHNWFNGCNIENVWTDLESNLVAVKKEIDDCKDSEEFTKLSQTILKASHGLDFIAFYEILNYIANKRQTRLQETKVLWNNLYLGINQIKFDLYCIISVLKLFVAHVDVGDIFQLYTGTKPNDLLQDLLLNVYDKL